MTSFVKVSPKSDLMQIPDVIFDEIQGDESSFIVNDTVTCVWR